MSSARRALRIAAASVVTACWAAVALASGGALDPSFSGDGWVRTLAARSPSDASPGLTRTEAVGSRQTSSPSAPGE
jgi:hypothetical protein